MNGFVQSEYLSATTFSKFLGGNAVKSDGDNGIIITDNDNTRATLILTTPIEKYSWIELHLTGVDAAHNPKVELHHDLDALDDLKTYVAAFNLAGTNVDVPLRFPYCGKIAAISITVFSGAVDPTGQIKLTSIMVTRPPEDIVEVPDTTFITPAFGPGWVFNAGTNEWMANFFSSPNWAPTFIVAQTPGKWAKATIRVQALSTFRSYQFTYQQNIIITNSPLASVYFDAGTNNDGLDTAVQSLLFNFDIGQAGQFFVSLWSAYFVSPASAFGGQQTIQVPVPGQPLANLGTAAFASDSSYLHVASNLADLNNLATARTNLGLGTFATVNIVGAVIAGITSLTATSLIAALGTFTNALATAQFLAPDGTLAAPSYAFSNSTGTGFRWNSVGTGIDHIVAGVAYLFANNGHFRLKSTTPLEWSSGDPSSLAGDTFLVRDAANTLGFRNGVNAQTFRSYGTFTDLSNYERLAFNYTTSVFEVRVEAAGTGILRSLRVYAGATLEFGSNNTARWQINSGNFIPVGTTNTLDIGGVANLPHNIYVGTSVQLPNGAAATPALQATSGGFATGVYFRQTPDRVHFVAAATDAACFTSTALCLSQTTALGWSSAAGTPGGTSDVILFRDAANQLALRNGLVGQTFNVYNTFTDVSNFERGVMRWNANVFQVGVDILGTGTTRKLQFLVAGTGVWHFETTGGLMASTDNTYDIGSNGANRPRSIYLGTQLLASDGTQLLPSHSFSAETGTGMRRRTANTISFVAQNAEIAQMIVTRFAAIAQIGLAAGDLSVNSPDVLINRDAANTFGLRNGTNPQLVNTYGTFTDPSNYERLQLGFSGTSYFVITQNLGTGAAKNLTLGTSGSAAIMLRTNGTDRWTVDSSGNLIPQANFNYDVGSPTLAVRQLNCAVVNGLSKAGPPTIAQIGPGGWQVYKDTTGGTTKIYYNDGGTIIASAAFV